MGLGQQFPLRRAADDRLPAFGVVQPIGEVGVAAFQARPLQRRGEALDVVLDPSLHRLYAVAFRPRALVMLHGFRPSRVPMLSLFPCR